MSYSAAPSFWVFWIFHNALLLTIISSFITERLLKPQRPQLNMQTVILQSLIVTILFLIVTLVVQRPIFSWLAVSIFLLILCGVSNAKFIALKEPLVFSDITMFSQAFKHPRLYFPFLGMIPVIVMPLVIVALIYAVLKLEPALAMNWQRILLTLVIIIVCFFGAKKIAQDLKLSQDPAIDNRDYGLLNSLFAYSIQARSKEHQEYITSTLMASPFFSAGIDDKTQKNDTPPLYDTFSKQTPNNITVIQSESFFDARRLHPSINNDVLKHYDECLNEASFYGKLNVPAWGANTMRTEFSFLTGLKYEEMGLYRFYPYQYLHKKPIVSLAKLLKFQGYHCVCIHPHPASFFGRDRIFPQLGFDEFIDIESFDTKQTFGPYISDQAVTDKILEVSEKYSNQNIDKPLFIFAITMENHGPLHLEKTTKEEQQSYFSKQPLEQINDLTVYLRHLKNADNMVAQLTSAFRESDQTKTLCFYGDHIPSMPKIYEQLDYKDGHSDYFIWNNKNSHQAAKQQVMDVDYLAETLLRFTKNLAG